MILSTIQSRAALFCGDPSQTRFTGLYTDAINDAQKQFALDSNALFKDKAYTATAGTSTYTLPTDFIVEDTVTYNGYPLKPISRHTLYSLFPGTDWTLLNGTPTHYMIDPQEAVLALRLIPIPQDALAISMRYIPLPADVSAASDVVLNSSTLMTQFHLGIAALAAWLVLQSEIVTPELQAKMSQMMKIYNDAVSKAIEKFGNTKSESLRIRPKK